jgi:penicillin-binding protein 1A
MDRIKAFIEALRDRWEALIADGHLWRLIGEKLRDWRRRPAVVTVAVIVGVFSLAPLWLTYHLYFDRSDLPDLGAFLRFDAPTTGEVREARVEVLIELAVQFRLFSTFDEVPPIVREAVLSAEDRDFFEHDGVDYGALPRVAQKIVSRSWQEWRKGHGLRLLMPQGGSTLTQQLVRVYFLPELTARPDSDPIFHRGLGAPRLISLVLGAHATNKLLRKMEEVRLTFWLEEELRRQFGSKAKAKREIFARYASFIYLGSGRYGYAAASEYYFGRDLESLTPQDAGDAALLAAIGKSPEAYTPDPQNEKLLRRRDQILELMVKNGFIGEDHARRCRTLPLRLAAKSEIKTEAPAAMGHVLEELPLLQNGRFAVADLLEGRIAVASTVDARIQAIVNRALEDGLAKYEKRHPKAKGEIQGSVVVLANADAAILAEAGGRQVYQQRSTQYSDYTGSPIRCASPARR